jgi:hypothetical protein
VAKASVHIEDKHKMTALHNASCTPPALLAFSFVPVLALVAVSVSSLAAAMRRRRRARLKAARGRECA